MKNHTATQKMAYKLHRSDCGFQNVVDGFYPHPVYGNSNKHKKVSQLPKRVQIKPALMVVIFANLLYNTKVNEFVFF